ncbi:hypothetical protein [Nodosilinea sp. E11]|uniref:hypothetical protein n=1 Tax=Nodosilinea sp. E11 TaxID=3037479 RepID=UPI0029349B54|nr:hypothetical protein [Nodosilinea sp. E11]WOD38900.1 hypothetical protein RRF56_22095 [Nodosilinea sp. E11]
MEYWEFLLQKEGDQSWLPLDTAQVEILEGRYRVMVHTSQTNTPVHIQISQLSPEGDRLTANAPKPTPKRRTLRRQGEINNNGLMVVMPFTRLGEGIWDLQCASAAEAEQSSTASAKERTKETPKPWRYAVQLRVVAQDSVDDDDWFADDGSTGLGAMSADQLPGGTIAAHPPSNATPALDLRAVAAAMDAFQIQLAADASDQVLPYALTLPHTALLGSEGELLELTATVTAQAAGAPRDLLTLIMRLSDPQTTATLALESAPVATPGLPARLMLTVTVPTGLSTRLLLGEVGLLAGTEVVAVQRFTVTVDVALLFDAIANQAETKADLNVVFPADDLDLDADETAPRPPAPDLKTWDIVSRGAPPRKMPILTLPRSSPGLPPKIYYPSSYEAAAHQPSLPLVGRTKLSPRPVQAEEGSTAPITGHLTNPAPKRGLSLPPLASPQQTDDPAAVLAEQSLTVRSKAQNQAPQLISHEAMGFKDLKLQDRFWNRLNELAVNLQQEAVDNRATVDVDPGDTPASEAPLEATPQFVPFAGEVVIYEDEDPTLIDLKTALSPNLAKESGDAAETVTPPMPSLDLPEGDLIAGDPIVVTLRVPFHPNRLYLKVWITDPQTRTLADEPRQLMNLLPNGQGQLEGSLQLTVPLGCLEAWFEAITIDMMTQQESYKTSVSRAITPAGLSSPSLDDFQL